MSLTVYHQIDLPLVELAFDARNMGKTRDEIRDMIREEYKRMGVGISTADKRWYLVAGPVFSDNAVTKHALKYWSQLSSVDCHEMCVCACFAAFPVLAEVAEALMQLTGIRESAPQAKVRRRLMARHGDRASVRQAVQKCLQSMRSWKLITSPSPGVDEPRSPLFCSSVIGSAAIAAALMHRSEDSIRVENVSSRSLLSFWDLSNYSPGDGHCIDNRLGALGNEYVTVDT